MTRTNDRVCLHTHTHTHTHTHNQDLITRAGATPYERIKFNKEPARAGRNIHSGREQLQVLCKCGGKRSLLRTLWLECGFCNTHNWTSANKQYKPNSKSAAFDKYRAWKFLPISILWHRLFRGGTERLIFTKERSKPFLYYDIRKQQRVLRIHGLCAIGKRRDFTNSSIINQFHKPCGFWLSFREHNLLASLTPKAVTA